MRVAERAVRWLWLGCGRVQRVLEHCTDEQKQKGIMEEILRSTCALAQDQYGNYVVQVSAVQPGARVGACGMCEAESVGGPEVSVALEVVFAVGIGRCGGCCVGAVAEVCGLRARVVSGCRWSGGLRWEVRMREGVCGAAGCVCVCVCSWEGTMHSLTCGRIRVVVG